MLCYSLGMVAYVLNPVLVGTFFCLQDSRSPLKVAAVMVIVHTVLACVMMKLLGYAGIALAGSLAACVASVLLWRRLQQRVGSLDAAGVLSSLGRSLLAALGMLAAGMGANLVVAGTVLGHPISRMVLCALAAAAAYALLQFLLNRQVCRRVIWLLRSEETVLAKG